MSTEQEIYILLGVQDNTYFFIHTVISDKYEEKIAYQIYNVLISCQQIVDTESNVIIYEFQVDGSCSVISISHIERDNNPKFILTNLETFLPVLLQYCQSNDNLLVIQYNYDTFIYNTYIVDVNIKLPEIPKKQLKIYNIEYVYTDKLIPNKNDFEE